MKTVAIGSDHAGFDLKVVIIEHLKSLGFSPEDKGTYNLDSVDYPDYAHQVASAVAKKEVDYGVLICGSANGVAMAANKHPEVRAGIAWLPEIAALCKRHNDANVICLPARFVSEEEAKRITEAFFENTFEGGRHERRVNKIKCF